MGRVEAIDVDRNICGAGANRFTDDSYGFRPAHLLVVIVGDDREARVDAILNIVGAEPSTAQTQLNRPCRIDELFLMDAAHEGRVIDFIAAELVKCVGMGIDMENADGAVFCNRAQDRRWNRMVTANRNWTNVIRLESGKKIFNLLNGQIFGV